MNNPLNRELLMENYRNPVNHFKPDEYTHTHTLDNRTCGDEITVYIAAEAGSIKSIHYEARACALAMASASMLAQALEGKPLAELAGMDESYVEDLLETKLSISRVKCGLLPLRAIQQALSLRERSDVF